MARHRHDKSRVAPATTALPEVDPALREAMDPDPLVEQMVERLRASLSDMVALDEFGRPIAWRHVVRIALGPTLGRLRDAETSLSLMKQVMDLPLDGLAARAESGTTGWPPFRGAPQPDRRPDAPPPDAPSPA